jgi:hypothetical protein
MLLLAGSAIMLRHYSRKIGRVKFLALVLLPSFYSVSILVDRLGFYAPQSETELFYYYVYSSLSGVSSSEIDSVILTISMFFTR